MKNAPTISKVIVAGYTSWVSEEYKTVGRFRGISTMKVAVRDESGKPAARAERGVKITVRCADGTAYVFRRSLPGFMSEHVEGDGYRFNGELWVHGFSHTVYEEHVPASVMASYRAAASQARAILRAMRAQVSALPRFRHLTAKAA